MSTHIVFSGVPSSEKAHLESYWARKLPRLERLLTPYRPELREIRLTVSEHERHTPRSWYEVRGVIQLPTGTLAADAEDTVAEAAIDRVADGLVAQVRQHRELIRRDYVYKRKSGSRADLSAAGPILQKHVEHGEREDFFRLLRPHLHMLRDYARRELRSLELRGLLHRGEATADDLMDEVLSRAWQKFSNRPRHLSLDLWLTDLVDETLEDWVKQEPRHHASLEERADRVMPDTRFESGEEEWWDEIFDDVETFRLGDLIPDTKEPEAWAELDAQERQDRILSLLRSLPPAQRQAFLLHALEDYGPADIAALQNRPESQVKADIEAARRTLRERPLAHGDAQPVSHSTAAARSHEVREE